MEIWMEATQSGSEQLGFSPEEQNQSEISAQEEDLNTLLIRKCM